MHAIFNNVLFEDDVFVFFWQFKVVYLMHPPVKFPLFLSSYELGIKLLQQLQIGERDTLQIRKGPYVLYDSQRFDGAPFCPLLFHDTVPKIKLQHTL